jgi:hypothetical protein
MDGRTKKKHVEKRGARKKRDLVSKSAEVKAKKEKPKKKARPSKATKQGKSQPTPTYEQIQLRAYFISEQRRNIGIAGDEHSDWVRAEKELSDELLAEKVFGQN